MDPSEFDFDLPTDLIAQEPVTPRDHSRLMVLGRLSGGLEHHRFYELTDFLRPGDCLVLNDTRVLPARLIGRKKQGTARAEILLLRPLGGNRWEVLCRPGRRLHPGTEVVFGRGEMVGRLGREVGEGVREAVFEYEGDFQELLDKFGRMPLPPYINRDLDDRERYQTVYSRESGSAAAPTAGLHFTAELLETVRKKGVLVEFLTLHVGLGTFRPVQTDRIEDHKMHAEFYCLSPEAAERINRCRSSGGRIFAVGTTAVRTLETLAGEDGKLRCGSGWTDIFIFPGYRFKCIDAIITNFHLPRSTLLMLVSAFAGRERILRAYRLAVEQRYRFFSFGDAMLILK